MAPTATLEQRVAILEAEAANLKQRLASGANGKEEAIPERPWLQDAGYLRDDPMLGAWLQAMAEYRRKLDEDTDAP